MRKTIAIAAVALPLLSLLWLVMCGRTPPQFEMDERLKQKAASTKDFSLIRIPLNN